MATFALGPMPGTSIIDAADVIAGETGDMRALPQLPTRGLGSDAVGRTCTLMPDLPVEKGPRAWRLTARPQILTHRIWDRMEADLDHLQDQWGCVPVLKAQVLGPWSLATHMELPNGHRAVTDFGAMRDITEALIHGIGEHVSDLHRRFGALVRIQIDEPALSALRRGAVQGTSDFDTIPAIHPKVLGERLAGVVEAIRGEKLELVSLNEVGREPNMDIAIFAAVDQIFVSPTEIKGIRLLDAFGEALASGMRAGLGLHGTDARHLAITAAKFYDELGIERAILSDADITQSSPRIDTTLVDVAHELATLREVEEILHRDAGDL
ncbi:hypothetical protein LJU02_04440 [Corynebacterium pseudotuberculosis]|uniref:Methionine synthase n=1 Tax=Corynebacterium pseudotuberculosis 258 TaxID=1168865 RepID=A0AAU8QBR3_CORPS|nr:hypothetical protein [Corynebacterium pseudotuberculosis]AER68929.1 Hypothetical protein Cp106_0850 [Corynebacterium pseudotuberculosis 1/06-A]AEQ06423.1 hypothetical protein CPCIP5297_04520 [Corynebacterium pseudotuberculosis CIP 52.97]AFB72208.1 hypothetical protein CP316_04500 [Corynebacterium pseudotuberculosis 316]AFK16508.1 hypothetical protein CP258_04515 [Corynebacterium pseudotuberculosis 258]AKS13211.1 Hypothetical protein CpE19_0872 [Corynebacterium pseudotuberculosis]